MKKIGLLSLTLIVALAFSIAALGQGRGGRGAPAPPPPPALQAFADTLAATINKQDAATLTKMTAMDATYLDEDGHAPPISAWIMNLTSGTPAKTFTITAVHGQMLDDNAAWVSFNYSMTGSPRGGGKPLTGTATIALKKVGTDWMIEMVHGALKQSVAGVTQ
jgi:hypothetical protein